MSDNNQNDFSKIKTFSDAAAYRILIGQFVIGAIQVPIILQMMKAGIGFEYLTICIAMLNIFVLIEHYGAMHGKWRSLSHPLTEVTLPLTFMIMIPLCLAFYYMNFFTFSEDLMNAIVANNKETLGLLKNSPLLHISPKWFLPGENWPEAIIYSFGLVVYASLLAIILGFFPSLQVVGFYKLIYSKADEPGTGFGFTLFCIALFALLFWLSRDLSRYTYMAPEGELLRQGRLMAMAFFWVIAPFWVLPCISSVIGYVLFRFNQTPFKEG